MKSHKLIELLRTFSRKEMTRFREFAGSPYHNKHEGVRRLVAYLSDIYPNWDRGRCQREVIWRVLFPGEPHLQPKLAVLFTYTYRLAEDFLAQEHLREQPFFPRLWLLQQLRLRQQYIPFEKQLKRLEEQLDSTPQRDGHFYYWRFRLAAEADNYFDQTERRRRDLNLQIKQRHLDHFYLAEKLRDACEMESRRKILRIDYEMGCLPMVLQEIEAGTAQYEKVPAVQIYYRLYRLIAGRQPAQYFEAITILEQVASYFSSAELKTIYNYLQNFCIEQINLGNKVFLKEIFGLYKQQLNKELLQENGFLSEWHYKNIVTTAIRLGELAWVWKFIEEYRAQLPEDVRDNAYCFNLASYFYAAGNYDRVLDLLSQVEYSDLRYSLGAKALLLRTYYDLGEFEALCSLTDSFRQYLLRNKLMADGKRQGYYNLFKLTRKAAQIRNDLDYESKEKLEQALRRLQLEIGRSDAIFNQGWLEEKVEALEKRLGSSS